MGGPWWGALGRTDWGLHWPQRWVEHWAQGEFAKIYLPESVGHSQQRGVLIGTQAAGFINPTRVVTFAFLIFKVNEMYFAINHSWNFCFSRDFKGQQTWLLSPVQFPLHRVLGLNGPSACSGGSSSSTQETLIGPVPQGQTFGSQGRRGPVTRTHGGASRRARVCCISEVVRQHVLEEWKVSQRLWICAFAQKRLT